MSMLFRRPAEGLDRARSALMAPHPRGETHGFAVAFGLCGEALRDLDLATVLDDRIRSLLNTVLDVLETPWPESQGSKGRWELIAEQMSVEDRSRFSSAVDELAHWFAKECVRTDPHWLDTLLASIVFP